MRSLADEVPFDIPDSWEWVRLGTVIELQSGQDMTPDKYNDCGKGIPYITGASNIENGNVLINRWTEYGRAFAYCGDILLTCKGTVGTMAVLREPQVHIARQIIDNIPLDDIETAFEGETGVSEGCSSLSPPAPPKVHRNFDRITVDFFYCLGSGYLLK